MTLSALKYDVRVLKELRIYEFQIQELIRDGHTVSDLMSKGREMLGKLRLLFCLQFKRIL